ncbi:MAG TPA: exonuclease domain-containing protein [Ignavibacteria bacterium]|nr:exonuclease domain-containing protein [Ignavibacteria bacterium]
MEKEVLKDNPKYTIKIDPDQDAEGKNRYEVYRDDYMFACGTATDESINSLYLLARNGLFELFSRCDLAGFNHVQFDVPFLSEEFARCGYVFPSEDTKFVDVKTIFHKREERSLSGAVKFYCKKDHTNAHSALDDVKATIDVLNAMKTVYPDLPVTTDELHNYCFEGRELVDFAGKLTKNEQGEIIFNFGKYYGKNKRVVDDLAYAKWMLNADFPANTKWHLERIIINGGQA